MALNLTANQGVVFKELIDHEVANRGAMVVATFLVQASEAQVIARIKEFAGERATVVEGRIAALQTLLALYEDVRDN